MPIITLTTDFGLQDWFVGTMKGVILGINPRACIVDITHGILAGDIRAGAFALHASCRFFPKGTVHVVVVDPGVGGDRKAIAVRTVDYIFVGPDNGALSFVLAHQQVKSIRRLENRRYLLEPVSHTFHGRDIFAPVAAHLSRGIPLNKLGPEQDDWLRISWPTPRVRPKAIEGEVVYIDRFGNAITNIENVSLPALGQASVWLGRRRLGPVQAFYQSVVPGKPVGVPGSNGFLEIAVNGDSAARRFHLKPGMAVTVRQAKGKA